MVQLDWVVGVVTASLSSFISNLGYNLQTYQHKLLRESADRHQTAYHTHLYWRIGFALILLGSIGDLAALSISPQSLIAPLSSLTLVSNVILAPLLLKERVQLWPDIVATLIIVLGSTLAVAFADHENSIYPAQRLFGFYHQPHFAAYAAVTSTYILVGYLFVLHMERLEREEPVRYDRLRPYLRFAYPSISGCMGGQSFLFAKCLMELLANTFAGREDSFLFYQTYLVLAAMLVCVFLQMKWLNEGLRRFEITYCFPVFSAFWVILSVTSGLIFYQEYREMSWQNIGLFSTGVFISVAGILLLSQRKLEEPSPFREESLDADADDSPQLIATSAAAADVDREREQRQTLLSRVDRRDRDSSSSSSGRKPPDHDERERVSHGLGGAAQHSST